LSEHNEIVGSGLHIARSNVSSGTPVGSVTPGIIGEFYVDSTGPSLYVSTGLTNSDWTNLSSGAATTESNLVIAAQFTPEVDFIFYDGWVAQENITITKGSLFAVTAPTGAAIIVDILINGVVQTKLMTLAAGATHQLTDITDLDVTAGQRVGLKITQVGSTNPGNGVVATLHYELT